MALSTCRECGAEVNDRPGALPRCGAPQPANPAWSGTGFEWKSSRTYAGFPLVHIAFGKDSRGKRRVAKGVIAIGQFALGLITVAQFGVGLVFGFGQVSPRRGRPGPVRRGPGAGGGSDRHRLRRHRPGGPGLLRPGANRPGRIYLEHVEKRRRSHAIFPVLVGLSKTAHTLARVGKNRALSNPEGPDGFAPRLGCHAPGRMGLGKVLRTTKSPKPLFDCGGQGCRLIFG